MQMTNNFTHCPRYVAEQTLEEDNYQFSFRAVRLTNVSRTVSEKLALHIYSYI